MATSSTSATRLRNFCGICSLNNVAVALLERQAFRYAMATLKDAILSMNELCMNVAATAAAPASNNDDDNRGDSPAAEAVGSSIQDKLERASRFLAGPQLSRTNDAATSSTLVLDEMWIQSDYGSGSGDGTLEFPLRMESFKSFDSEETGILLMQAILVCNCAMTQFHSSKALLAEGDVQAIELQTRSFELLKLMLNFVSGSLVFPGRASHTTELHQLLVLSAVIVKCIIKVATELGKQSESETFCSRLDQITSNIRTLARTIQAMGFAENKAPPVA